MKYKELLPLLPKDWNEVTLKMFIKTLDVKVDTELEMGDEEYNLQVIDNVLLVTASMLDVDVNIIRKYDVADIISIYNKMAFLNTEIEYSEEPLPTMKKEIDFSFDNMINYNQLMKDKDRIYHNLPSIIKTYLIDSVTDEDVLKLKMPDVMKVFFCSNKFLKTFLETMIQRLTTTKKQPLLKRILQTIGIKTNRIKEN